MIHPAYASDDPTVDLPGWSRMVQVKALNTSVDTCSPFALSCPETGRPQLDISTSGSTTSYTDSEGRVTQYTTSTSGVTGIRLPGSSSDDVTVAYLNGKVSSVTRLGVTTNYSFVDNITTNVRTATITHPDGSTRVATFDLAKNVMLSDQDERGKTTGYQYDTNNRPTRVTQPEGNYTQLTYDSRGNVTQALLVPKSGSGLSNITLAASYDATCANVVKCNQPNWTRDGKGNETDYTYDPVHGGVLTVTRPAPATGGVRPQTRVSYTRLGSSGSPSATGVFMPTGISLCQTTSSCTGGPDEAKTTIACGQGLLPASSTQANGTATLSATTAATYDVIGNLLTVDRPLSGTADTTAYRYNSDRELVGVIGPDPDGGGALKNRAVKNTFDSRGLVTKQEIGTTAGQTDTAWNAFAPAQRIDIGYGANRRPVTQKLSSGATAYALTQMSYDNRGRLQCSAVRMNTAAYGSLPADACTLGTAGSFGQDRITKVVYDAADEVTQVQQGVGTTDAATERTLTYSDNGLVSTLKDAENNLTTFAYDGFDRWSKTRYPVPAKGGNASSTTDYEQALAYDANSSVTSFRNRAGQTIGFAYDNLNRVKSKDLPGTEPDVTYAYDNLDRLTSASQSGNALSFGYDTLGRKTSEGGPLGTTTFGYDLAGRRTSIVYPSTTALTISYAYLVTGELDTIKQSTTLLADYSYDNLGNRTGVTFGNGASQSFGWDAVSRLSSLGNSLTDANDLSVTFGYNPAGQIASTVRTGDMYAWTGHGSGSTAYTQNGLNQQVTVGGAAASWDSNGNLTSEPQSGRSYGYSSENLLTSSSGGTSASLSYDPALRLYQVAGSATTRFLYDGMDAIAEYDGSSALQRRFVFDPTAGQPVLWYEGTGTASTDRRYLSQDERGSVVSVSGSTGASLGVNTYDEYGKPGASNLGRYQYTGQKWLGDAGVYDYHYRDYVPQLGIFAQPDPLGYGGDGPNLYAYVLDDPVNGLDPLGLCIGGGGSAAGNINSPEMSITCPRLNGAGTSGGGTLALRPRRINSQRTVRKRRLIGIAAHSLLTSPGNVHRVSGRVSAVGTLSASFCCPTANQLG